MNPRITPVVLSKSSSCIALLCLLLSACASLDQLQQTRSAIETSKFELYSVQPKINMISPRLTSTGIVPGKIDVGFTLGIQVDNRFGRDLPMNRMDLTLFVDGEQVAAGTTRKSYVLSHRRPTKLSAFVEVQAEAATRNLVKRLQAKKMHYRVEGTFYFNIDQFEIPITVVLKKDSI
jgi:hypothetical protein